MSTRHHANTRGQRHQWPVGLTAWTVERARRTSNIWYTYCSVLSCREGICFSCFSIVSSAVLCIHCWIEALNRSLNVSLVCVTVGSCARDLFADNPLPHVLDRGVAPSAGGTELLRAYGPWRSWLGQAPVCCACGDRRRRDSADSFADSAPPCARRDWPDCGPADYPSRVLCRH